MKHCSPDNAVTDYRAYVAGAFGQIHYRDGGAGVPLVLLHQAPLSLRQFDTVFSRLCRRGLRPIAIDLPGYGQSDSPPLPPSIANYASAPIAVLDALRIPEVAILGHHTGALVATEVALQFPERVSRVILNGPLPLPPDMRARGLAYVEEHEKGFRAAPDGSHLAAAFRNRLAYANKDTKWELASRYIGEQLTARGPFWYAHEAAFNYDHEAALSLIQHPAMILTNTGDEIYELARSAHKLRPDFTYREIAGGGVDIVDEKPDEWVDIVAQYILNDGLNG